MHRSLVTLGLTAIIVVLLPIPASAESAHTACGTPVWTSLVQSGAHLGVSGRPNSNGFYDSATVPVRVHYTTGYETEAQASLVAAEETWAKLTALGFIAPLTDPGGPAYGGTTSLDIYMEVSEFGGYAAPEGYEGTTAWADMFGYVSINPQAFTSEYLPSVVAHEVAHVAQFAMDIYEDPAFMEATSAWAMDKVYPTANLASQFIGSFQGNPEESIDYFEYAEPYQYGASLFLFYVSDVTWNNDQIIPYLWQASMQDEAVAENEPDYLDVLDDALQAQLSIGLEEYYPQFARARFFTGPYHDGTFTYGSTYGGVRIDDQILLGQLPIDVESPGVFTPTPIAEFGSGYTQIGTHDALNESRLLIDFKAPSIKDWNVLVLGIESTGLATDFPMTLKTDPSGVTGDVTIENLERFQEVHLQVTNVGDGTHDPDSDDWGATSYAFGLTYDAPEGPKGSEGDGDGGLFGCSCAIGSADARGRVPTRAPIGALALVVLGALGLFVRRRSTDVR